MNLNSELAQYIVDYTAKTVDYVINIMDSEAVIIASTDPSRIGEMHIGAKEALLSGEPYVINSAEAQQYPNVIPGISLPIHFKDTVIGVVGVGAGEAGQQVFTIGKMLQGTVELLIEQFSLKETMIAEEQVRNQFLIHLVTEPWFQNEAYFRRQLHLHHFEQQQAYLVVTVRLSHTAFAENRADSYESEVLHYEKSISRFLNSIRLHLDISGIELIYIADSIVFLIPCKEGTEELNTFSNHLIGKLQRALSFNETPDYTIGIGGLAKDMTQIHAEYLHSVSALSISDALCLDSSVVSFDSICFEYLISGLSQQRRKFYWEKILGELINQDGKNGHLLETLECFFKNDQSIKTTAEDLFIHRNTLLFRLNRIWQITGFHPQNLKDAVNLYTALTLYKFYRHETPEIQDISSLPSPLN